MFNIKYVVVRKLVTTIWTMKSQFYNTFDIAREKRVTTVLSYLQEGIFVVFIKFRVGEKQDYWKLLPLCVETLPSDLKTLTTTKLYSLSCKHFLYFQDQFICSKLVIDIRYGTICNIMIYGLMVW